MGQDGCQRRLLAPGAQTGCCSLARGHGVVLGALALGAEIRPRIGCPQGPRVSRRGSGCSHHTPGAWWGRARALQGCAQPGGCSIPISFSPSPQAISAFVSLIITGRFLVAAMLLLLVEVSNIFLTARMLLKMSNVPSPALYRANKYVNLVMYFAFRLAPQAYLTWYFLRHVEVQGQGAFLTANLLLLDAMILMYFSRLLRSDFCPSLRQGRDVDGEKFLID